MNEEIIEPTEEQVLNAMLLNWKYDEDTHEFYRHTRDGKDLELGAFTAVGFIKY